jgi:hypothetical protein
MIVTVHQPEHLPWLGFFDKMRQADVFVLLDTTQYVKRDFQNRNRIKTKNGPVWLTVPVHQSGKSRQDIDILDVEICYDRNWRGRCWNTIFQNYSKAPHFEMHQGFFEDLYTQHWSKLVDLNTYIIRYIATQLGITTPLVKASELGTYGRGGTNIIFSICHELGASAYLSGKHGKDYLDETLFQEHGIEVRYQQFEHPVYPQIGDEFVSHMSAIDLLCNCGERSLDIIARANPHATTTEVAVSR